MSSMPYKRRLVIESELNHMALELLRLTEADDETWTENLCVITAPGMRCELPLSFYGNEGLPQFFDSMTSWWRQRRSKETEWEALEAQLSMRTRTDAGHVYLDCRAVRDHVDGWRLQFELAVESGEQLLRLAKDCHDYFKP
jgi:hypothetical protein